MQLNLSCYVFKLVYFCVKMAIFSMYSFTLFLFLVAIHFFMLVNIWQWFLKSEHVLIQIKIIIIQEICI